MRSTDDRQDSRSRGLVIPSVAILTLLIIGAVIWTYTTRDWNASGTHKVGSPSGSTPSEGGKPLILNK